MQKIKEQFEKIIFERRKFEKMEGFSNHKVRNVIRDFKHFEEIVESTFLGVPNVSDLLVAETKKNTDRYRFLMRVTIAFNLRYYDALVEALNEKTLYPWNQNNTKENDLFILLLWKQNLFSMISSYSLVLNNCHYQAMSLLRGYIESSAILYLCLLDFEFLEEYSASKCSQDEYMKKWFKKLKPSKVRNAIKQIHQQWKDENEEMCIQHIGLRAMSDCNILISDFVEQFYMETSNYVHFSKQAIFKEAYSGENNEFFVGLNASTFHHKNDIIGSMIKLFSFSSGMLEMAISYHLRVIKYNELMGDFSELNVGLQNACL